MSVVVWAVLGLLAAALPLPPRNTVGPLPLAPDSLQEILANDNRSAPGKLKDGILSLRLEARTGIWYPEGDEGPGHAVHAFAEEGGPLRNPGPLMRVPAGTEIRVRVRNAIRGESLVVQGLHARPAAPDDTFHVASGGTREVRFPANEPGTYFYWATTTGAPTLGERYGVDSQLSGALIVDPPAGPAPSDRIFVIGVWVDPATAEGPPPVVGPIRAVVVNGRSWPHSERLGYAAGDSVRWRWINASDRPHPMHLHGFYFRVHSRGTALRDSVYSEHERQVVVTETVLSGGTFSLLWVPDRPGNWLMHCHTLGHIAPELRLGRAPPAAGRLHHTVNHALEVMAGLAVGVQVEPPGAGAKAVAGTRERRRLRLLAQVSPHRYGDSPGFGFVLHEGDVAPAPDSVAIPGPPIVLTRGEPVSITVVNRLPVPTSVHWHGIELASYYDGVSGWSGDQGRTAPAIAPGDSFVAEFTPPRAGTFIYHTHFDERPQLTSGLYGALIVLEPGQSFDPRRDRILVLSTGGPAPDAPPLLNGQRSPVFEFEAGHKYRLRLININPGGAWTVTLLAGDSPASWRSLAKDGADLSAARATVRPARQLIGVGETYDFEFAPTAPGELRLDVRNPFFGEVEALVRVEPRQAG
ncbi:MAG: multicopper oxidase domain-containing protein [Gemmatimonadetes bacterium]|nr:multicopper oxidase domain-containing protein [Gemmatimonadota bacterium]